MDWYTRYVLSWRLSTTQDVRLRLQALDDAIHAYGTPQIFKTDQASQFTCKD
jgi:putative transposase